MITENNITDLMATKFGAPQTCPNCNGENLSGLSLPEQCRWCGFHGINEQCKQLVYIMAPEGEHIRTGTLDGASHKSNKET